MPRQTANSFAVTAFERRPLPVAPYRRAVSRTVSIGVGTVTTASVIAGTAAVAAAWMVSTALNGAPHFKATPLSLETAALIESENRLLGMKSARLDAPAATGSVNSNTSAAPATLSERLAAVFPSGRVAAAFDYFSPTPLAVALHPVASARRAVQYLAQRAAAVPLPMPRPRDAVPATAEASAAPAKPANSAPVRLASLTPPASRSTTTSWLEKFFAPHAAPSPSLAAIGADGHTAVYDIEAHAVYMPDGSSLEAHSGLGGNMDDPSTIREKARGPTPPNVYDLVLRDGLFHGVQAIRLNPVDDSKMYHRDGILAHPYMLGPTGQSFGCVSFRDYGKFLAAFQRGEVNRLIVVRHLDSATAAVAPRREGGRYAAAE